MATGQALAKRYPLAGADRWEQTGKLRDKERDIDYDSCREPLPGSELGTHV